MTIAVDWDVKNQTKPNPHLRYALKSCYVIALEDKEDPEEMLHNVAINQCLH